MKVIVTGGSGFLGGRIIATLAQAGHTVVALARSSTAAQKVRALGADAIAGDLAAGPLVLPKADALVHAAAHFRLAGPRRPYFAINVAGTARLLSEARSAGIGRFIYISAGAVVMDDHGAPLANVDEHAPTFPNSSSAYIASKAQGEALVLAANAPDFVTLALRPPGIWGAGDAFSAALPNMVRSGQFGFVERGAFGCSTCHVDNVVEAIACALQAPATLGGRAFFINDAEPVTFRDFVIGIAHALGLDVSKAPTIPYGVARIVGAALEASWGLLGRHDDPPFSRSMVRLIGREFVTNDAAARAMLGYRSTVTRAQGLARYRFSHDSVAAAPVASAG